MGVGKNCARFLIERNTASAFTRNDNGDLQGNALAAADRTHGTKLNSLEHGHAHKNIGGRSIELWNYLCIKGCSILEQFDEQRRSGALGSEMRGVVGCPFGKWARRPSHELLKGRGNESGLAGSGGPGVEQHVDNRTREDGKQIAPGFFR